jgi:murein DD-endopeptidase MepM/ murein hydrolase activator NlpD
MTDKGRYRRSRLLLLPLAFFVAASACGSAKPKQEASETAAPAAFDPRAALSAHEAVDGAILLLTVRLPAEAAGTEPRAEFEGNEIPLFATPQHGAGAYEAVFGVPYNHAPGPAALTVRYGEQTVSVPFTIKDGNYPTENISVSDRFVNPRKKDLLRIERDRAEIGKLYRRVTREKFWNGPFILPVESAVTSPFGTKRLVNGEMQSFHQGLDLKAGVGTPIRAAGPGEVVLAKDLFFTGYTVLIDHGYGVFTIYAHLSKLKVRKGQRVKAGRLIGLAGQTGRVSGPHLHWGAIIHRAKVNPLELTRVMR